MASHQDDKDFDLKPTPVDAQKDSATPEILGTIPSTPPIKIFSVLIVWIFCCLILYIIPICGFPLIAIVSLSHYGLIDAIFGGIAQVYGYIYDHLWIACATILPVFIHAGSFTAELDEARTLARMNEHFSKLRVKSFGNGLWRYYLHRNQGLLKANLAFETALSEGLEQTNFELYLQTYYPKIHRLYYKNPSFFSGMVVRNVNGHIRTGHVRYTSRGPVNIRSHHVSGHTRIRSKR